MPAYYDLEKVKTYAEQAMLNPMSEVVFFSALNRSVNEVMKEFNLKGKPIDLLKAKVYILESIVALTENDFSMTQQQWGNDFADWYGVLKDQVPWMIKFLLEKDEATNSEYLEQISFHRIERDLKLENGKTLKTNGTLI